MNSSDEFANKLIQKLIEEGVIKDANNIPEETVETIMEALREDIIRVQKEKGGE